jgi:hypothetical protein
MMYDIEMQEMSESFYKCWNAAGAHLNKQVHGGIQSWLRAHPYPPFLEHLSFRLGNQLFFVRVEDADHIEQGPGTLRGLLAVAQGNRGHACILPMKTKYFKDEWMPKESGWGLIDATTGRPVDPFDLVTDEKIEMTEWELQDMAVQIVRVDLQNKKYELMTWQSNPGVDPSIWFVGDSGGPEWIVVRAARYPLNQAQRPASWQNIANQCAQRLSSIGHFASVAIASAEQPFISSDEPVVPLWRGYAMNVRFTGLE